MPSAANFLYELIYVLVGLAALGLSNASSKAKEPSSSMPAASSDLSPAADFVAIFVESSSGVSCLYSELNSSSVGARPTADSNSALNSSLDVMFLSTSSSKSWDNLRLLGLAGSNPIASINSSCVGTRPVCSTKAAAASSTPSSKFAKKSATLSSDRPCRAEINSSGSSTLASCIMLSSSSGLVDALSANVADWSAS